MVLAPRAAPLSTRSLDGGLLAGRSSATASARGGAKPAALAAANFESRRLAENRAPRSLETAAERTVHGLRSRMAEMERDHVLVEKRCASLESQIVCKFLVKRQPPDGSPRT